MNSPAGKDPSKLNFPKEIPEKHDIGTLTVASMQATSSLPDVLSVLIEVLENIETDLNCIATIQRREAVEKGTLEPDEFMALDPKYDQEDTPNEPAN